MKKIIITFLALVMCVSITACGSGEKNLGNPSDNEAVTDTDSENLSEVDTIDLSVDDGSIKYVGFEYASEDLVSEDNVIILKFEYTNNQNTPAQCQSTFYIQAFQNGVELDSSLSYSSADPEQYELCRNFFSSVMNGGTVTFGTLVQTKDSSPLTIMVRENGGLNGKYQSMELDISDEGEPDTAASDRPTEQIINIGDVIQTDDFDFTLKNVELTYEILPPNTSSAYTSYTASDGKIYVHIDGDYYNKSKKDVHIRDLFVPTVNFNDGYTYNGFVVVDDGDNSFTWVSSYVVCVPLATCHYHGLVECPSTIESSGGSLYTTFTINGTTYRYNIR